MRDALRTVGIGALLLLVVATGVGVFLALAVAWPPLLWVMFGAAVVVGCYAIGVLWLMDAETKKWRKRDG